MTDDKKCACGEPATASEDGKPLCERCHDAYCFGCGQVGRECGECGGEASRCGCGCDYC